MKISGFWSKIRGESIQIGPRTPNNPKKSFDVYINKNPSDTIPIKYTTVKDVKRTIKKLESLFKRKEYPHKRIWQVGMILKVRLEAMKKHKKTKFPNAKNVTQRFNLANAYMYIAWVIALLLFYILLNKKTLYEPDPEPPTEDPKN